MLVFLFAKKPNKLLKFLESYFNNQSVESRLYKLKE